MTPVHMAELRNRLAGQQPVILGHGAAKSRVLETCKRMEKAVLIRTHLRERVVYVGRNGLIKLLDSPTSPFSLKDKVKSPWMVLKYFSI